MSPYVAHCCVLLTVTTDTPAASYAMGCSLWLYFGENNVITALHCNTVCCGNLVEECPHMLLTAVYFYQQTHWGCSTASNTSALPEHQPGSEGSFCVCAQPMREINFISLFGDRGHWGPYSPYLPCNHNLYIGIIAQPTLQCNVVSHWLGACTILCMRTANERQHCSVTSSLIGWVYAQNDPWTWDTIGIAVN